MKNNIGILFDFNGTLLFDSDKHEKAWHIFIEKLCKRVITADEFQHEVHGRTNDVIIKHFTGKTDLSAADIQKYSDEKEAIYREILLKDANNFCLVPGAERFLEELIVEKIPFTIATASPKINVDFYIEQLQLNRWFDVDKIVYFDGSFKGKPNPDIYLIAAEKIMVEPQNCLVFEDAISGIKAAFAANVKEVIGVAPITEQKKLQELTGITKMIEDFSAIKVSDLLR
jgi:haloacid dehalogenase superfamily, subfamily IA, variant 3 with third motif having DD or ED